MRVAHVITGLNAGGAEAALTRLCVASAADDDHMVVSLADEGVYGPQLRRAGIRVEALGLGRGRINIGAFRQLVGLLKDQRPEAVQTWMYHANLIGGLAARAAGARRVVWGIRNSDLPRAETGCATRAVNRVCSWLSPVLPTKILYCAERARTVHEAMGYDRKRGVVTPNGYALDQMCPDKAARDAVRRSLGVDAAIPLVGMLARWDPQKDHCNLFQALVAVRGSRPNLVCLLAGAGMDKDNAELDAILKRHDLSGTVRLLGRRQDVAAVLNALDLHILSSAYGEAFPNVVAEAMACGVPVVTTDVGDASAIAGRTGWCVPPRAPDRLASALMEALDEWELQPDKWSARQRAARERIKEMFSLDRMVQRFRAVWRGA